MSNYPELMILGNQHPRVSQPPEMPDSSTARASAPHVPNHWTQETEPSRPLPPSTAEAGGGAPWEGAKARNSRHRPAREQGNPAASAARRLAVGPVALSEKPLRFSPPTPAPRVQLPLLSLSWIWTTRRYQPLPHCLPRPRSPAALGRAAPPWGEGKRAGGLGAWGDRLCRTGEPSPPGRREVPAGLLFLLALYSSALRPPQPPRAVTLPALLLPRCLLRVRFSRLCESPQLPAGGRQPWGAVSGALVDYGQPKAFTGNEPYLHHRL